MTLQLRRRKDDSLREHWSNLIFGLPFSPDRIDSESIHCMYAMLGLEARAERERAAKLIARIEKVITPKEEAILFARSAGSTAVANLLGQINGALTSAIEDYKKGEAGA